MQGFQPDTSWVVKGSALPLPLLENHSQGTQWAYGWGNMIETKEQKQKPTSKELVQLQRPHELLFMKLACSSIFLKRIRKESNSMHDAYDNVVSNPKCNKHPALTLLLPPPSHKISKQIKITSKTHLLTDTYNSNRRQWALKPMFLANHHA